MNYPTEMQQTMPVESYRQSSIIGSGAMAQKSSINGMPIRDKSPVDASYSRLTELLHTLRNESDLLIERLEPVARPETTAQAKNSGCAPAECQIINMLETASAHVEAMTERIMSARARLCI